MDVIQMLEDLNTIAVERVRTVGPLAWGLKKDDVAMKITMIKSSLPDELKQAFQTMREAEKIREHAKVDADATLENTRREGERILAEARKEAEKIIEHAHQQQERMVHDSEVLKLAKAQSEELRSSADRDAIQMRRDAEAYAYNVLRQLESVVGKVMAAVERGKSEMDKVEAVPNGTVQPQREKVRA